MNSFDRAIQIRRCNDLHEKAMGFVDEAFVAGRKGEKGKAAKLTEQAYEFESEAARIIAELGSLEPTRSVLFRSAASLAINCGKMHEASKLIEQGLSGEPPAEIAEELMALKETLPDAHEVVTAAYMETDAIENLKQRIALDMAKCRSKREIRKQSFYWEGYLEALFDRGLLSQKDKSDIIYWIYCNERRDHWQNAVASFLADRM